MSGFSVAAAFREWESGAEDRPRRQPICALTTLTGAKEKHLCHTVGIDFFESKPAQISGLMRVAELCVRLQSDTSPDADRGTRRELGSGAAVEAGEVK